MRDNLAYRETVAFAAWAVWWAIVLFLVAAALVYVTVRPARAHNAPLGWAYDAASWCGSLSRKVRESA